MILPPKKIYLDKSPVHGRGVFASEKIEVGEVFEVCPYLELPIERGTSSPLLIDYRFNWPQGGEWTKQVVGLGFASFYNHNNNANANWRSNIEQDAFEFYATKEIFPGEEIFVWYGGVEYWNDGRQGTNII